MRRRRSSPARPRPRWSAAQAEQGAASFSIVADRAVANSSAATGLLFLPTEETEKVAGQLTQAEPLIAQLATDPSLRGLVEVLQMGLPASNSKRSRSTTMLRPLTVTADTVDAVLTEKPAHFSWHELLAGGGDARPTASASSSRSSRSSTSPHWSPATRRPHAIRQAAADLKLAADYGARVRLTGPVAIADEEFATVQEGMVDQRHRRPC